MPSLFGFDAFPMEADKLFGGGPRHDVASPVFMMEVCFCMPGQLCVIKRVLEACLCAPFLGSQCALPAHTVGEGALLRVSMVHPLRKQAAVQGNFAVPVKLCYLAQAREHGHR